MNIPEGWKLAPEEPTEDMRAAAPTPPVAAPALRQAERMTDEEIDLLADPFGYFKYGDAQGDKRLAFARAIEAEVLRHVRECNDAPTPPVQHSDDVAVDRFAAAMRAKLAQKRAEGRGGWDDPEQCPVERLAELLHEHVSKGDPIDVANFSMMLWCRGGRTTPPVQQDDEALQVLRRIVAADDADDMVRLMYEVNTARALIARRGAA